MNINFWLNGVNRHAEIYPDTLLIDFLREQGCYSVKRGCETANCGLCTVLVNGRPVLSCSTLAARVEGKKIVTLEGMQREAKEFGSFLANEGAEQCGFCNPGFIMNVFAMLPTGIMGVADTTWLMHRQRMSKTATIRVIGRDMVRRSGRSRRRCRYAAG